MMSKILIVDDNPEFRHTIIEYLRKNLGQAELYEASTGEMGVAKASCITPDIVLMDINLPHSNGVAAAKQIKMDCPKTDVIILTMFEVEAFKDVARKIKAKDFIGKSEVYDRLLPVIDECLKKKEKVS